MTEALLCANDFIFGKYGPGIGGDSGPLTLAVSKADPDVRYVVKGGSPELACNEFMYHKLATALGLYTQDVRLFRGGSRLRYAAGIRYSPTARVFQHDDGDKANRRDFYAFQTLYVIVNEDDSQEFYIDERGRVFKLDNAASFNIDAFTAGIAIGLSRLDPEMADEVSGIFRRRLELTEYDKYELISEILTDRHGQEGKDACIEMFERFAGFDETVLDEAYETLGAVYPPMLSDYYCEFILIRKGECARFLREQRMS